MYNGNHCSVTPSLGMSCLPGSIYTPPTMLSSSMSPLEQSPPRSSRNTEKRRERSKVAARCRRGKESEIFSDLSQCLPVTESSRSNLDKASVMRLTLCDLKLKEMIETIEGFHGITTGSMKTDQDDTFDSLINSAISGFVIVCSTDGDVIYASDGISTCLGLSQYEVMGQSLLEFTHPCDQADVKELLLNTTSNKSSPPVEARSALFRLKSANSTRGRNVHHRSTNYKVVSCIGRMFTGAVSSGPATEKKWYVGICEPLLHPADVDIPLNKQTFLSKHTPDMKFEYVDESISDFMGYKPNDMVGKSLFDFYHACDGETISRSFKSLYTKGQTVTERSRFLAQGGGWIWVLTQATTINNNAGKPTSVVCIHFVTSGVECEDEIVSHVQLRSEKEPVIPIRKPVAIAPTVVAAAPVLPVVQPVIEEKKPLQETTNLIQKVAPLVIPVEEIMAEPLLANPIPGPILSKPTPSTAKIFAPRTEDMDSGFLMPVNDTLIVTKEEPDDLRHLAPIAGPDCVPLSNVPLLDDLLQWLDAEEMDYTVMEGYEEPIPIPLISQGPGGTTLIDSPIPIPMNITSSADVCPIVKDDVSLNSSSISSDNSCSSPLLLRSIDPTLMSTTDPMLLSPYKTLSPDPISSTSTSKMDFMSSDIFSTFYSDNHNGQRAGGGGATAGSSSHKSKAGGGYDDESFSGFPMVSDFQETLFSPSGCMDDMSSPPSSPPHLINLIDTGGHGQIKLDSASNSSALTIPRQPFGLLTKQADVQGGKLQYVSGGTPDPGKEKHRLVPELLEERPLPAKVAKGTYTDEQGHNKPWLLVDGETPTQPPWKTLSPRKRLPSPLFQQVDDQLKEQQPFGKQSQSTGTQTILNSEHAPVIEETSSQQRQQLLENRQRQLQRYRQLLMNPMVLQALLLSGRLMNTPATNTLASNPRKRNFVGKLLSNDGLLSTRFGNGESGLLTGRGSGGASNLPGAGFLELPSALVELTDQDCEVNAPLLSQPLLDGADLITALDTEMVIPASTADCM